MLITYFNLIVICYNVNVKWSRKKMTPNRKLIISRVMFYEARVETLNMSSKGEAPFSLCSTYLPFIQLCQLP